MECTRSITVHCPTPSCSGIRSWAASSRPTWSETLFAHFKVHRGYPSSVSRAVRAAMFSPRLDRPSGNGPAETGSLFAQVRVAASLGVVSSLRSLRAGTIMPEPTLIRAVSTVGIATLLSWRRVVGVRAARSALVAHWSRSSVKVIPEGSDHVESFRLACHTTSPGESPTTRRRQESHINCGSAYSPCADLWDAFTSVGKPRSLVSNAPRTDRHAATQGQSAPSPRRMICFRRASARLCRGGSGTPKLDARGVG